MSEYEPPKDCGKAISADSCMGFEYGVWYRTFAWVPTPLEAANDRAIRWTWLRPVCVRYRYSSYNESTYRPYDPKVLEWRWAPMATKGLVRTITFIGFLIIVSIHACN